MIDIITSNKIAIIKNPEAIYPSQPFHPSCDFPEYPFKGDISNSENHIYSMVRELLYSFGLDSANFGTAHWNPLGELINPGDRVLLKPNFVRHYHPYHMDISSIITHGSIIRVILDYVYIALKGEGDVVIGDASIQSCDFEKIKELAGLSEMENFYHKRKMSVSIIDFRLIRAIVNKTSKYGTVMRYEKLPGDPAGYYKIDVGNDSFLESVSSYYEKFRVPAYNPMEMAAHHRKGVHKYMIPKTVLKSDVVINLPKMKTHHKAGVTGALKNAVGINNHKDCLPHHRTGSKDENGDEYQYKSLWKAIHSWFSDKKTMSENIAFKRAVFPLEYALFRLARRFSKDTYFEGSWWGNDTIWRTILDLNKILIYADADGNLTDSVQRKIFSVVDGIIAGEDDGPLAPTPKKCGILICGFNSVAVDTIMAEIMGFDFKEIPQINNAYSVHNRPFLGYLPEDIEVILSQNKSVGSGSIPESFCFDFNPSRGWRDNARLKRKS